MAEQKISSSVPLLIDSFDRIKETVHGVIAGLTAEQLAARLDPDANSIAWLVWHLTRVQDDHLADAGGFEQAWTTQGWADRFGFSLDTSAIGYGHSSAQVAAVRVQNGDLLTGYHDAVHEQTVRYLRSVTDADLARIVDTAWNPPVTLAVRLISVIDDDAQHAGQAAFIRGILQRR